jgi:ABC-type molybdate transport system substrate-binding protein
MVRSFIFAAASAMLLTVAPIASAKAAELNVLAGGSMTDSLREIAPRFESATRPSPLT